VNIFLAVLYTVLTTTYLFLIWDIKRANPLFYFIIFQWIISIGSLLLLDLNNIVDQVYGVVIFLSQLLFIFGAFMGIQIFNLRKNFRIFYNLPVEFDLIFTRRLVAILTLFSIIIVLIYYQAIGYNLLSEMALGPTSDLLDFKSLRLATYSGENYYAPGFVNQFKNILLPLGLTVILLTLFAKRKMVLFYISLIAFGLFLAYALLGTGQRAPLAYAIAAIVMGLSIIHKIPLRLILVLFVAFVAVFSIISFNSGRVETSDIFRVYSSFFVRIFFIDQYDGLLGFRYIYELDHPWFYEWLQGLLGILPGHPGSNLDHELYANLHGTSRGTSSLTFPGSTYYNGSLAFVIVVYPILGILYSYLYYRMISGRRTVVRSLGYGGLIFISSVFVMGSPVVLLNKGALAFILVLFIRKLRI
jgi:oligosaccharide repeat unit polymerase